MWFLLRLAAYLGIEDPIAFADRIDVRTWRLWFAFYRLCPWGDEWRRTARAVSMLAASNGAKVNEDFEELFLPTYDPRRPLQTEEQMAAELAKLKNIGKPKKKKA